MNKRLPCSLPAICSQLCYTDREANSQCCYWTKPFLLQMDRWLLYRSFCQSRLRSCPSTAGTPTSGCRGSTSPRRPPSLAGCSQWKKATASAVDNTTSPCKTQSSPPSEQLHLLTFIVPLLFPAQHFSLLCRHLRWGAPPVINPTGSVFPNATLWSPSFSLILPVTSQSSTTFNLSDPAAGDWFIAAHLPEDDRRIEQKVCSDVFLPFLSFVLF